MTRRDLRNVAASVHARLLDKARAEGRRFDELLQYYAMERFLFRLSLSPHVERFVLKGALMLRTYAMEQQRLTRDIDLLGFGSSRIESLVQIVRNHRGYLLAPPDQSSARHATGTDAGVRC